MIEKGYGFTVISNFRLMMECMAICKYLWKSKDSESENFLNYANIQLQSNLTNKKQDWISDKNLTTIGSLVKELKDDSINQLYDICCNYVHASPFSIQSVYKLNRNMEFDETSYFPLGFETTIENCKVILCEMTTDIIDWFMEDGDIKRFYKGFNSALINYM